jgi:hypothetical protein
MSKRRRKRKTEAALDLGAAHYAIRSNCSTRAHTIHKDKKKEAARKACRQNGW